MSSEMKEQSNRKLDLLYSRYKTDMYRVAYRILEDEHLAQDAVQSSFAKIIRHQNKIDEIDSNKTRRFIVTIVRNASIDIYRKRNKESNVPLEDKEEFIMDGNMMPFDEKMIKEEILNRISMRVKEMNKSDADIIALKYFYQFSDTEIAEILNISPGNERVRLHRAKQRLKKLLIQDGKWWKDE